jgi:hypothetical protein
MTRKELAGVLETVKQNGKKIGQYNDYHENDKIMEVLEALANEYGEGDDVVVGDSGVMDDVRDQIIKICDSNTPIYNADLAEWFAKNWSAYDEVAEELGKDNMGKDVMQGIAIAYSWMLALETTEALEGLK